MKSPVGQRQSAPIEADGFVTLPPGKAREICVHLQSAILEHRIRPGAKLSEDEVGEIFGVSRTVVRGALQALAHSQLVTIEPHRGAFVANPSQKEALEVFGARALIEPGVAAMAAAKATKLDIKRLLAHNDAEHDALANEDMGVALALSGRFHIAISDISGQAVLGGFIRSLISRSSLIIALYWRRRETACESHCHAELIDALAKRKPGTAEQIMKRHILELQAGLELKERTHQEKSLADMLLPVSGSKRRRSG